MALYEMIYISNGYVILRMLLSGNMQGLPSALLYGIRIVVDYI